VTPEEEASLREIYLNDRFFHDPRFKDPPGHTSLRHRGYLIARSTGWGFLMFWALLSLDRDVIIGVYRANDQTVKAPL